MANTKPNNNGKTEARKIQSYHRNQDHISYHNNGKTEATTMQSYSHKHASKSTTMAKQKPEKCKATATNMPNLTKQKPEKCKASKSHHNNGKTEATTPVTNLPPQKLPKTHNNGKTEARKMQGCSHKHAKANHHRSSPKPNLQRQNRSQKMQCKARATATLPHHVRRAYVYIGRPVENQHVRTKSVHQ